MKEQTKRKAAILLFVLAMFGSMLACGYGGMCYSQYAGCEATAAVIATAAAMPR